jgi:flagellar hook-length control protein FliK
LVKSSKDISKKDTAPGEESWLAVLLGMTVPAWPEPFPPPVILLPWVLEAPLSQPPALVGVEAPKTPLVDQALTLAPPPPAPEESPAPTVAEPPPPAPEAFRLEVKWQTAELGPSAPPITAGQPVKPDQPEASRPQAVAVARPETAAASDDGPPERDPNAERNPALPPVARRIAPLVERATVAEPALPGNQMETVRAVRPAVEAPVPQPAPLRAAGDAPGPPPSPGPPELHGLERAIERAELRQTPQTSELNLWMRPEHLGKVAVRLIERAGVVEIAVRAETSLARSWLAEGLPGLFDRLHERDFETRPALRGAEAGLDGRSQDHADGRRQQARDGQKWRDREAALFSLEPGETS